MGFINKDTLVVDAILTRSGREYMRRAVAGETTNEHVITKFALGDDEIDYSLWDVTPSGSNFVRPLGQIIDNQPLIEAVVSGNESMNFFLTKYPPTFSTDPETPTISDTAVLEREKRQKEAMEDERQRERQRREQRKKRQQEEKVERQEEEKQEKRREQKRRRQEGQEWERQREERDEERRKEREQERR